jgi:hypothetical protein
MWVKEVRLVDMDEADREEHASSRWITVDCWRVKKAIVEG